MATPTLGSITVYGSWPPEPSGLGGGGLGSGLWDGIGWSYFSTPRIVPAWYIAQILNQKEAYYFSHYSEESRYYHDPKTTRGMVEPLVNALIPETGKVLGYMQDLLKSSLDESSFKILKAMARTHAYFMQSVFSWSAIQKDIASGTDPKVAVGSEVASVAVSAMIAGALAGLAGALIAIEGPAAVATIAINIGVSTLLDTLGLKGEAAKLINDALAGAEKHISAAGETPTATTPSPDEGDHQAPPANVEAGSPAQGEVQPFNDGVTIFSDYQLYLAMKEIGAHPDDYPDAAVILPAILADVADRIVSGNDPGIEANGTGSVLRTPPEIVHYADIEPENGVKSFVGKDGKSYLFIGDETPSEMVGGNAINWFMPKNAYDWSNKVVGNPDGYNVLDFSLNGWGVDIVVSGNDRMDKWIADRASTFGLKDYDVNRHFLTHESALGKLRGYAPVELTSGSYGDWCPGEYRNIDYLIGSDYDDILVGDVLGGMTFTGRGGNDTFVVHGGGNRIVFNDGDFVDPDSGEITTKYIHGLTTAREARDFNLKNYQPAYLGGYGGLRIEPDVLDFSNLDGDLNTEGHQAMRFIGTGQFTGHAGELRYVTEDHYGLDLPATHDEDGVGWRATTVCLEGDRTGGGIADFFIEYTNYADPSIPYGSMFSVLVGVIYPYLDSDNFFFG